jgi:hypothetical protein
LVQSLKYPLVLTEDALRKGPTHARMEWKFADWRSRDTVEDFSSKPQPSR